MTNENHTSGYLDVDGARLYYESRGAGPAIVFVHAGIADSGMWDTQFAELAGDYRVVRYDMRNFGRTEAEDVAFEHDHVRPVVRAGLCFEAAAELVVGEDVVVAQHHDVGAGDAVGVVRDVREHPANPQSDKIGDDDVFDGAGL